MERFDLLIVGGGPAGMAAACEAKKAGVESVLLVERDNELGGILNQCIHPGFGLEEYKEELTGPEFSGKLINELNSLDIDVSKETMVVSIDKNKEDNDYKYEATLLTPGIGVRHILTKAVILAMGCRERTRGAINIGGDRPSGIMTAGQAQRYINIEGLMVGKKVVILGSGDIGLIMARRLTLEGAKVISVCEIMPWSGGLRRNIVQCLDDFEIPLRLSTTVTNIKGEGRLHSVTLSKVDENLNVIPGTEEVVECDTLLLSVGLIPENELTTDLGISLSRKTNGPEVDQNMLTKMDGVFAAGNVLHVHDLVDNVVKEARKAGKDAAIYLLKNKIEIDHNNQGREESIKVEPGFGLTYILPQRITLKNEESLDNVDFYFRVNKTMEDRYINITQGDNLILRRLKVFMTPGEMEKITIPLSKIKSGMTLKIGVEE